MRRSMVPGFVLVLMAGSAVPAAAVVTEDSGLATLDKAQNSLSARLGPAFGGSWLDPATGALVVGVTDPARATVVRAAGAQPRVVRHSAAELAAGKSALDKYAGLVPSSVASWYVDVMRGTVVVEVVRGEPEGVNWARRFGLVEVRTVDQPPRPVWNLAGGQWVVIGDYTCSAGFNAHEGGERYVITAGHCTKPRGTVNGVGGVFGLVAKTSFPGRDYGLIWVTQVYVESSARITHHRGGDVFVAGTDTVPIGGRVCRSGQKTGWHCGIVTATNVTDPYDNGKNTVYGLTRTTVCAESGDSGGPFVSDPRGSEHVQAQGITSGAAFDCGDPRAFSDFQPIKPVLSREHLKLYED